MADRLFMVAVLIWVVVSASACGVDASKDGKGSSGADHSNRRAAKDKDKPPPADFDGPAKPGVGPTHVLLRVSGSEGGVYKGWFYSERNMTFDALYHTDKPDFRGVIKSEPTEYNFTLENGSYKDPTGDWVWNRIYVDLKKDTRGGRDWDGELYAEFIVDGKEVSCEGTPPFEGLTLSWSPEQPEGGAMETLNCK